MASTSPLFPLHQQAEASFLTYGDEAAGRFARVVETFGEIEGEYAAIRKGCVLIDLPHRGTLRVSGADRLEFLNRMVTQELKGLRPFHSRDALWLNRKGRVDADLRLTELPDQMLVDVDLLAAAGAATTLGQFVFSENVEIADVTESWHRLGLHGPTALALLRAVSEPVEGPPLSDLSADQATIVRVAGHRVVVDRRDTTGEVGLELSIELAGAAAVYHQLLERGLDDTNGATNGHAPAAFRLRAAGWHAYNIARIEAGTPLFNIDFGTHSLPAETGVLDRRVSFTKGCYLGQEVVARMRSLGHPKQVLVALRVTPPNAMAPAEGSGRAPDTQPMTGSIVATPGDPPTPVGAVTSSTRSPMLGDAACCFAQVRWGNHEPGTTLLVDSDAGTLPAVVQPTLTFWSR